MLSGQILNSDALLNNFIVTDSKGFIPGEQFTLIVRLFNEELQLRFVPLVASIVTFTFNKTDGTQLSKVSSGLDSGDRSMRSITISEAESEDLLGGNFSFEVDVDGDGQNIRKGIVQNGLARVVDGDC
jgi:hypothetical protein